ncbi:hypothetical protein J121_1481 [Qipengyuania citrea LAMA 915]|uniref:Uncharacterized protein n=1 Tax=Qipengyuania citrea LAMA 915 TaxID=1306953 RepID=A0A0L1KA98_9SPHN|nr:hypothetical protein J121_1481 [Qipengyuania citrea LAMA 915]
MPLATPAKLREGASCRQHRNFATARRVAKFQPSQELRCIAGFRNGRPRVSP